MITRTLALLLLVAIVLPASVLVQFDPPGANLAGAPGQTVSWNFKITNTVDYLLISQVDYLTLTPAGIFQDTFSAIAPVIGPGDVVHGTSLYTIDLPAPLGYLSTGQLVVTYDEYSVSPNDPNFDPGADLVGGSLTSSAAASVQVAAASSPEPATFGLLLGSAALLIAARKRQSRLFHR